VAMITFIASPCFSMQNILWQAKTAPYTSAHRKQWLINKTPLSDWW